jgi:hypothetical protein
MYPEAPKHISTRIKYIWDRINQAYLCIVFKIVSSRMEGVAFVSNRIGGVALVLSLMRIKCVWDRKELLSYQVVSVEPSCELAVKSTVIRVVVARPTMVCAKRFESSSVILLGKW